jgi:hypothetical protein
MAMAAVHRPTWPTEQLPQSTWTARGYRKCIRFARSRFFSVWRWTVRFVLLSLLVLSGIAIYFLWYDNIYGVDWTTVVGSVFLAIMSGTLGPWFFTAWLFRDTL